MGRVRSWSRRGAADPWSEAALERAARALADWALRQEPPSFDPERQGQWAGAIARLSGEEKVRRIVLAIESARKDFRYQRLVDLVERRRYPPAVFERAERLLSTLAAERGRDVIERQRPDRRGDRQPEPQ
jgi:hypothetical protein